MYDGDAVAVLDTEKLALAVLDVWGPSGTSEETLDAALRCLDTLLGLGVGVCALTWYMGYKSIGPIFALLGG